MRLQFITLAKSKRSNYNIDLKNALVKAMESFDDMEVVDSSPELVHVFGPLTSKTARAISHYKKKEIPVVFTIIDGISTLVKEDDIARRNIRTRLNLRHISQYATIHCCGPIEETIIKNITRKANTAIIRNALVTEMTTRPMMTNLFHELYNELYKHQEENIKEGIKKRLDKAGIKATAIHDICFNLIYLRHLYTKGCIRKSFLDETASFMTENDYDEEEMRQTLKSLKLSPFASSSMSILETYSSLTEGFMPVDAKDDKVMRRMEDMIVQ